jgi:hypothetical protein
MLSGRHPFHKPSMAETLSAVLRESPELGADIPPGLTVLVKRLPAKAVEDRYASPRGRVGSSATARRFN